MKPVRSIFVSDLHLGCKFARADALLAFLQQHRPRFLYLVGDFVDGWRLRKSWYWNDTYSGHIHTPMIAQRNGVRYLNTGDWVESCTALVEYTDGTIALIHFPLDGPESCPETVRSLEKQPLLATHESFASV